ncbi:hypothetical protein BDB00DRAFT_880396 [Zychaea mexicana]|uniref:uncharacterized protein n=1 Tax=Zychaea mexicana TaxID=64656 RepID=UPI0022FE246A|nr:uncharacterized protein BDB00DRAFT_880396 [Zychaea mexicana]KAI9468062.1 hypothetical protein BDB00DRAFT_880396 [Zychaea mexicana]
MGYFERINAENWDVAEATSQYQKASPSASFRMMLNSFANELRDIIQRGPPEKAAKARELRKYWKTLVKSIAKEKFDFEWHEAVMNPTASLSTATPSQTTAATPIPLPPSSPSATSLPPSSWTLGTAATTSIPPSSP